LRPGPIHAVAYSASPGTYILTGSADRTIRLYNPSPNPNPGGGSGPPSAGTPSSSTHGHGAAPQQPEPAIAAGRLIQSYSGHGYEVLSLSVAADNARFASAGGDRAVFLWDVATAQTLRRFAGAGPGPLVSGHSSRINAVSFGGADDSLLVSGGFDTTVRIWDTKSNSNRPVQVLTDAKDAVTAIVVRASEIVAGSVDGRVRSYDVRMGRTVTDVIGASITSLSLTRDGKAVLVGGLDSKLRLMDRENGTCLKTFSDPEWRNEELRVQSVLGGKERFIVAGDEMVMTPHSSHGAREDAAPDGLVWVWDLMSGKLVAKISVPWGPQTAQDQKKRVIGRDGREKARRNVISCLAWRDGGFGDQFCVGGTSGTVTVFDSG
jgi:mitogen-activated protein kinase organizer 1